MLKITLTRGLIGKTKYQRAIVRALGLSKYGSSVTRHDSPAISGMLRKVHHLVTVTRADSEKSAQKVSSKSRTSSRAKSGKDAQTS